MGKLIRCLFIAAVLAAAASLCCASPARIAGGQPVALGEMPYIGSLIYRGWHNCSVTILSTEWVLTAAQCIWGHKPYNYYVRVGSVQWDAGGTLHSIASGFHHEDYAYDDEFKKNDIAVIKVTPPLVLSDLVQPVVLAERGSDVNGGTRSRVAGWGSEAEEADGSPVLMKTDLEVLADAECAGHYGEGMSETQVCAWVRQGAAGICLGDAGSPVMVGGEQVGVSSWTRAPCGSGPSVASQVSYFRDWIHSHTGV